MNKAAVFLDRDGVINVRLPGGAYVTRWEDFVFCKGAKEALRLLAVEGYMLIVVTNQRGVGRGLMTEEDLGVIHGRMREELKAAGAAVDDILHCPHDLDADCGCRKPRPGMIEAALSRYEIDPSASIMIGDSESDMEAARAAGVKGILIVPAGEIPPPDHRTASSLLEAARAIVKK